MRTTFGLWMGCAVATIVATAPGCELLVGNENRTVEVLGDDGGAAPDGGGSIAAPDAAATRDDAATGSTPDGGKARPPIVDAATPRDAGRPPVDAATHPADAAPPPPTCPPQGAPPGTLCCGTVACIGEACQHCDECRTKGCASNEYCCAVTNGGGHFKGVSCSATPSCQDQGGGGGNDPAQ